MLGEMGHRITYIDFPSTFVNLMNLGLQRWKGPSLEINVISYLHIYIFHFAGRIMYALSGKLLYDDYLVWDEKANKKWIT